MLEFNIFITYIITNTHRQMSNYYNTPLLTITPNSSKRKLILVLHLASPPSLIITNTLPPDSMYVRSTLN